jgi:glycosyltransferase involved in cell wall biosynthesis
MQLADGLIVHEGYSRRIVVEDYGQRREKTEVIPHGIEVRQDKMAKDVAKRALGAISRRVLLFFGYLAGYKGLDILIDSVQLLAPGQYILFVAGGEPQHLEKNSAYNNYIKRLRLRAGSSAVDVVFAGFVPEARIPIYFSAADLMILPYPEMHACSGPFCLAMTYECPFLVSRPFAEYYGIPPELSFEDNAEALSQKIEEFFDSADLNLRALEWTRNFRQPRLWSQVAKRTLELYCHLLADSRRTNAT